MQKHTSASARHREKTPLTKRILAVLIDKAAAAAPVLIDETFLFLLYPFASSSLAAEGQWERDRYFEELRVRRALRDLEQRALIIIEKRGKELSASLTDAGQRGMLTKKIRSAPVCRPDECVIVIFDVPESQRRVRDLFRAFLQECGFTRMQHSVWVSRCQVLPLLHEFFRTHVIGAWVHAFRAYQALPYTPSRVQRKRKHERRIYSRS